MSKELIEAVLDWWEEHQYDCIQIDVGNGYMEDCNTYGKEPKFVRIAQELVDRKHCKQ